MKNIYHFPVGNGNCSVIELENFVMVVDLNKTEDAESTYEMLKPYFRKNDNDQYILDVLCITHGDEDHCLGFEKFKSEIDNENLIIGSIWHQGYDKTAVKDKKELSTDYLTLKKELDRREKIKNPKLGEYIEQPKTGNTESDLFNEGDLAAPEELSLTVISPLSGDDESSNYDQNDLSIVLNFEIDGFSIIYAGDSTGKYWQDRIFPDFLDEKGNENKAKAETLVCAHHGSFSFFGSDRKAVREANPLPDNYDALDSINPKNMILSSGNKFPGKDAHRDDPPHYAARKWYHKWFVDNRNVKEDDKHPDEFKYTSEECIRIKKDVSDTSWKWVSCDNREEKTKAELDKISKLRKAAKITLAGGSATNSKGNLDTSGGNGVPNDNSRKGFYA